MKFTYMLCLAFLFSMSLKAQGIFGPFRVCADTDYSYGYAPGSAMVQTVTFTVIDGIGYVTPYNMQCYIKFPHDNFGRSPRIVARVTYANGSIRQDTSQAVTVLAIAPPIDYASITRSFPCNFRGNTTVTIGNVPNASSYDVTNDAGWPVTRVSATQFTININNGTAGTVALTAKNDSCNRSRSYFVPISRPKPALGAITGPNSVCNNIAKTFSVPAYPNAVSYTWTANNTNIRINGQASPVTITGASGNSVQISSTSGNYSADISVVATGECGATGQVTKNVGVGIPQISYLTNFPFNGLHFGAGNSYEFTAVLPANSATPISFEWDVFGGVIQSGQGTSMIYMLMNTPTRPQLPGAVSVHVRYQNECGWSDDFNRTGNLDGGGGASFTVSPNPTSNLLNIVLPPSVAGKRSSTHKQTGSEAILYDLYYKEIKRMKLGHGVQRAIMDVQDVKEGTYILQLIKGGDKYSTKVVIAH